MTATQKLKQELLNHVPQKIQVSFLNPEPHYYDEKFATQFENCIRDKFKGLNKINEVPSNYVMESLKEFNEESMRSFF